MKLAKLLCSMFLFAFLALTVHKTHRSRNSAKVCEHKTKDCARSWTFQDKSCDLCLFL